MNAAGAARLLDGLLHGEHDLGRRVGRGLRRQRLVAGVAAARRSRPPASPIIASAAVSWPGRHRRAAADAQHEQDARPLRTVGHDLRDRRERAARPTARAARPGPASASAAATCADLRDDAVGVVAVVDRREPHAGGTQLLERLRRAGIGCRQHQRRAQRQDALGSTAGACSRSSAAPARQGG